MNAAGPAGDDKVAAYARYAIDNDGDPQRGEQLFAQHDKLLCTNCHNVEGKEKSGPNLEGIGDKFNRQQLIEQVLYPSKSIKPGFEQVTIVTKDGNTHVGRIERINQSVHRIINAQAKQYDIPSAEVDFVQSADTSLMPDNLVESISRESFADLVAYLRTLNAKEGRGLIAGGEAILIQRPKPEVTFTPIHTFKFENPVWCGSLPGTKSDLLVIEHHQSKIWRLIGRGADAKRVLFLDLSGQTYLSNNQGLNCIALHPEYATNRRYFLKHEVQEDGVVKSIVVERHATQDGLADSGQASRRLLEVVQPAFNHNGGCIEFGPDGMLYVAFGDGGPQRDPPGYSQSPRVFHGSMLRIDVDTRTDKLPYGIPADNPFREQHRADPQVHPETWAIGFREPWRFTFDAKTGELYVGDVGQDKYEEVCVVQRGQNHGWNVREGFAPFSDEYLRASESYVEPLFVYEHGLGFSITGGHVYRGSRNQSFDGVYVFGDFNTRRVWGLRQQAGKVQAVAQIGTAPGGIASFGVDQLGEHYLVDYMGTIYHIDLQSATFPSARPL